MFNFYRYPSYRNNNFSQDSHPSDSLSSPNNRQPQECQSPLSLRIPSQQCNQSRKSDCKKFPSKKKFDFKSFKKNTCESLDEVEYFLCNFSSFVKYIKLYNLFKK